MLWLFAATLDDLRAALPTWVPALASPEPREVTNPFTNRRMIEITYNPTPDAAFEDPPEERPPPFDHANVWEPEARVGWLSLYEAATEQSLETGDEMFDDSPAWRLLCREVLCGRPGGPMVRAVPDALRARLSCARDEEISVIAGRWVNRAATRLSYSRDAWGPCAQLSLAEIAIFARTPSARAGPWFSWEDSFDW